MSGSSDVIPVPLPAHVTDVVVFGGTFDPPHRAHIELPARARDALQEQVGREVWLLYIPAARSPHKDAGAIASDDERAEMLERATAATPRCGVWREELSRGGTSYTLATLARLKAERPELRARLLIGADQALAFDRWRGPREIIELAEPLVMLREPCPTRESLEASLTDGDAWSEHEIARWGSWVVDVGVTDVNATSLREALRALHADRATPEQRAELAAGLDPDVLALIEARGLYAGG